jgi:hypothetical protein
MKLLKNSKQLMEYFTKHIPINQTKRTDNIIIELYNDIYEAFQYLTLLKQRGVYYTIAKKKIINSYQIIRPKTFNINSLPTIVAEHINEFSIAEITYNFSLYNRNIKVHFILEEEISSTILNGYIDSIIMWIYILNKHASKQCANSLAIFLYFTSLKKSLPDSQITVLNETHINTAFTRSCPKDSEIVIFRKEEWFKVLIHETFHNFGLDFSDMNNTEAHNFILNIFKVTSDVNIYESYTEFWAEIINALFCSFFSLKNKRDIDEFLSNSEFFINFERSYSFFQLVKTLKFMGLTYKDLYNKNKKDNDVTYNEHTSVLAYYVIKTILMNNYQGFMFWCKTHNSSLIQFNKTISNQREFCKFIEKNYKTTTMLNGIANATKFIDYLHKNSKKNNLNYILSNMRMSICELG